METHFSGRANAHPCTIAQAIHARRASLVIALAAALIAGAANAETAPSYSTLFRQAEASAPRLAESQANVRSAEGRAQQAGLRPNPSLGLEVENLGTSGSSGGNPAVQSTLSIGQPLELGGKRSARVAAGQAGVTAAAARNRQTLIDFGYDLAISYAAAEAAQARVVFFQEAQMAAQEDLRAARALVDDRGAGRSGSGARRRAKCFRAASEPRRPGKPVYRCRRFASATGEHASAATQ